MTILPHPKAGDIRWSLRIASGREHAEVFANAQGVITGADLAGTQRAKTLDLFNEPELVANAAAEFRAVLGGGPVLTAVGIDAKTVSLATNMRVVLPERLRPKIDWRDPAALAGAVSRIGKIFGQDASIASIVADERGGRITIDDKANGGRPATFELSGDGATPAAISFSLESMGPRFSVADLAPLTEGELATVTRPPRRSAISGRREPGSSSE
ncbi:MAG: hypothetical protein ACHQAQ_06885 [Hyphomicrobiales bacterium]